MRATKLVLTVKHLTYKKASAIEIANTEIQTFKRCDMIEVFKILTGKYDTNATFSFEKHQDCRTRGII